MAILWSPQSIKDATEQVKLLRQLADELRASGFDEMSVPKLLNAADGTDFLRNSALYSLWSHRRVSRLVTSRVGVLTQLFARNGDVALGSYEMSLTPRLRWLLQELGLVEIENGRAVSHVSISPYASMYFLSDQLFTCRSESDSLPVMTTSEDGALDPVMPPHASSLLVLDEVSPRCGRLLDVGCGSGFLGLVLSNYYDTVTGIDIDPRAVAYSQVNSVINGRRAEFYVADYMSGLDTIGSFDHVVFNAPGRAPRKDEVLDSDPLSAGKLITDVADSIPAVLTSGGRADVLVVVSVPQGKENAHSVVRSWLRDRAILRQLRVTELDDNGLSIPADAIEKLRIQAGCLLANDREDAKQLVMSLNAASIREVRPVIISIAC